MEKIEVKSKYKSYNIFLGEDILDVVNKNIAPKSKKVIITDTNVYHLGLTDKFMVDNLSDVIVVPSSEKSKSFDVAMNIIKRLTELNFNRNDVLIACGGGVVGDLTGFVASIYMRGIEFVQIPTTLLAMVDSSVGGKTAINFGEFKNNVGSFYNPKFVVIDTTFLETLKNREFNCGLAEIIKMGLIKNEEIIKIIEKNQRDKYINKLVKLAILGKIEIVEEDEKENGIRKILNFGHTIGHAVESYFGFGEILHGEAVAIGMLKMIDDTEIKNRLFKIFHTYGFDINFEYDKEKIFNLMVHDKKVIADDEIDIILLNKIGEAYVKRVSFYTLKKYL